MNNGGKCQAANSTWHIAKIPNKGLCAHAEDMEISHSLCRLTASQIHCPYQLRKKQAKRALHSESISPLCRVQTPFYTLQVSALPEVAH